MKTFSQFLKEGAFDIKQKKVYYNFLIKDTVIGDAGLTVYFYDGTYELYVTGKVGTKVYPGGNFKPVYTSSKEAEIKRYIHVVRGDLCKAFMSH